MLPSEPLFPAPDHSHRLKRHVRHVPRSTYEQRLAALEFCHERSRLQLAKPYREAAERRQKAAIEEYKRTLAQGRAAAADMDPGVSLGFGRRSRRLEKMIMLSDRLKRSETRTDDEPEQVVRPRLGKGSPQRTTPAPYRAYMADCRPSRRNYYLMYFNNNKDDEETIATIRRRYAECPEVASLGHSNGGLPDVVRAPAGDVSSPASEAVQPPRSAPTMPEWRRRDIAAGRALIASLANRPQSELLYAKYEKLYQLMRQEDEEFTAFRDNFLKKRKT